MDISISRLYDNTNIGKHICHNNVNAAALLDEDWCAK